MTNTSKRQSIKKTSSNQQNSCKKAVILMQSKSLRDDIILEEKMLTLAAKHNLSVIKIIKRKDQYDAGTLDILVETVKEQKQPVTIITENCEYIYSANILACCVIGTLAKSDLITLGSYGQDVEGKLFLSFPTLCKIRFFQIAEMHLWGLMNEAGIKAANDRLVQDKNNDNI